MSEYELPHLIASDEPIRDWELWGYMNDDRRGNLERARVLEIPLSLIEDDDLRAFAIFLLAQAHPSFWSIPASSGGKYHPPYENAVSVESGWSDLPMGGLIKHIIVVTVLALDILRQHGIDPERPGTEVDRIAEMRDTIVFAAITHDWAKNGDPAGGEGRQPWGEHTYKLHGELCAELLIEDQLPKFLAHCDDVSDEAALRAQVVAAAISVKSHYGVWSQEGIKPQAIEIDTKEIVEGIKDILQSRDEDEVEADNRVNALLRRHVRPKLSTIAVCLHAADYVASRKYMNMPDVKEVKAFLYRVSPAKLHRLIRKTSTG